MSLKIHVFYGAQYLSDLDDLDKIKKVPDGSYVKINNRWYEMMNNALSLMKQPISLPSEVIAQLALLGERV